jgi:ribosomal protein S18 acetylase RimI-like enzyme
VHVSNLSALEFYKSLKFVVEAKVNGFYSSKAVYPPDAYLLSRRLRKRNEIKD